MRARAPPFFGPADGDEADLPTFQDSARAAHGFLVRSRTRRPKCCATARSRPAPARAVARPASASGWMRARPEQADFERLLRHGARHNLDGYTMYVGRRDSGAARLGLLISRRHAPRAVVRNRIKRCIREAFRLEQERLGPIDVLVRPPYGVSLPRRWSSACASFLAGSSNDGARAVLPARGLSLVRPAFAPVSVPFLPELLMLRRGSVAATRVLARRLARGAAYAAAALGIPAVTIPSRRPWIRKG